MFLVGLNYLYSFRYYDYIISVILRIAIGQNQFDPFSIHLHGKHFFLWSFSRALHKIHT